MHDSGGVVGAWGGTGGSGIEVSTRCLYCECMSKTNRCLEFIPYSQD